MLVGLQDGKTIVEINLVVPKKICNSSSCNPNYTNVDIYPKDATTYNRHMLHYVIFALYSFDFLVKDQVSKGMLV